MATNEPPKDFDLEEEEENEEGEEEREEEAPPPPSAPAPKARRSKKERKSNAREDRRAFQAPALVEFVSQATDAEELVVELLDALGKPGTVMESKTPYDVELRTHRVQPIPRQTCMFGIDLSACVADGTESPSDKFLRLFDDYVHIPMNVTNVSSTYNVVAVWKATGKKIALAKINRPSNSEIQSQRNAIGRMRQAEAIGSGSQQPAPSVGLGGGPPPPSMQQTAQPYGYPQPPSPQQQYYPAPGHPYPPPPYYPPPYAQEAPRLQAPPPPAGMDPRVFDHFTRTQKELLDKLNEANAKLAEKNGQPPPPPVVAPPPMVVQPPPPQLTEEELNARIAKGVVAALVQLGPQLGFNIGVGAAPTPAPAPQVPLAPPPPNPAQMYGEKIMGMAMSAVDMVMQKTLKTMGDNAAAAMTGATEGVAEGVPEAVAEVVKPEASSNLPFEAVETMGVWPGGQKVVWATSKDGKGPLGGLHLGGVLASNPFLITKLMEVAGGGLSKVMEAIGDMTSQVARAAAPPPQAYPGVASAPQVPPQAPAQVVSRIPSGAVDATPYPPPPPQAPLPPPAPPPSPDAPDNGGFPGA